MIPHISKDEDGHITLEWWHGTRKITMYPHDCMLLKVWGTNVDTEMEEVSLDNREATQAAFDWLMAYVPPTMSWDDQMEALGEIAEQGGVGRATRRHFYEDDDSPK